MRILMLGWELPPDNSGGLGVACYGMCEALASRGVDIEFILPYTPSHEYNFMKVSSTSPAGVSEITKLGGAYDSYKYVFSDGHVEWLGLPDQQLHYEQTVSKLVEYGQYDIIHAHDWLTFRAALRAKESTGLPFIAHVHSVERDRSAGGYGNPFVREIEATAFVLADKIIAVSEHTKQTIASDYHIPSSKIDVIHNSIDPASYNNLDEQNAYRYLEFLKSQGYKVVVNVGRLTIQKGLSNFLRAAQLVIQKRPKTIFMLVGAGELYHELIEQSAQLGIADKVLFAGFQRGKNWRDAFAVADLFVLPSVSEPFGLTPLEAIGYGTPALISKQAGVGEVLNNCLRVDYWDIDEMANQILAVINHPSLAEELHASAFKEYLKMSWGTTADRLMDLYDSHVGVPV